jgi:aspartate racemase
MPAIGILGGMGPQASARLHTLLIQKAPQYINIESDTDFPEVVHISAPVPNFIHDTINLETTKQMLIARTSILEDAGCVINGIACNTAHLLLNDLRATTNVPFVSLPHLVASRINTMGHKRVGLLATPNTLSSTLFDDALSPSIVLLRPSVEVAASLDTMIFQQIKGVTTIENKKSLHKIVDTFIGDNNLDVVILGCTELPLIFDTAQDERVIDTLHVLADGLLEAYVKSVTR